jgi:carbon monoxide dehydrogenase subunit G
MAQFEGVETFPLPVSAVFAKLSDAGFVAGCLSGATVGLATPDKAEWKVKPKLAFISGSLDTTATVTAREPDARAVYQLFAKGIGATTSVDAVMTFAPTADGTTVTWTGDITARTGLLKLVPPSLIEGSAKKVIADVWADVRKKVLEG